MVFGFGKKKSEKTETTITQERHITLSEINQILSEKEQQLLTTVLEKTKPIREEIDAERKNIIHVVSELERDDLETDDIDKRLKVIVEQGKRAAIEGLRKETSVNLSGLEKYSDIVNLNSETGQLLKRMGDILGKNSKVLNVFARKYADKLKEHISSMAKSKSNLQKIVDEHTAFETISNEIVGLAEKIKNTKEQIKQKKHNINEIKKNIEKQSETIHEIKQHIDELKSKTEYQEFVKIKKEIESLGSEKNKIKLEIDTQFSKISRPLGKYSYVSSLDKPLKKIMEELIAEPIEVIKNENKNAIVQILQSVVKGVVSGNVSVKDTQKSIEQIEETIQKLDEFIQAKEKFSQKLSLLEDKLTIFDIKNLEENEKMLSRMFDDKLREETKISSLEKEADENTKIVPQITSELENRLAKVLLTKVSLKIQD